MASTAPPSNLAHSVILACQTGGICFAVAHYTLELRAQGERREDRETLAALDRCAAFALHAERAVLELEYYRRSIEQREQRRARWAWFFGGCSEPRPWAEVWLDARNAFEPRAREGEANRVALKNLWFIAKQAWERHPTRRDARIMRDFFFDAPLNAALAQRCLRLCEEMDEARLKRRGRPFGGADRPSIYPFMEEAYAIADRHHVRRR
ncbi:hypothetical protein KFE25_007060 [Diacronema lutheri]|uniref:Uncharacterized protein n=1 Tax=Diacronema lutheri TaxID=2081491 RepID=A0A8J6CHQ9_DIALT|nr:hypothetical protein KFE25_007060 [Diacronema lutheri]